MIRLLHVSDLHFGRKNLPHQVDALLALIVRERFDVVAVTGDLSQRTRSWEFTKARNFLETVERTSRVVVVPGNHDCEWWKAPLGIGWTSWKFSKWRRYMWRETEPVLRVPGATFVGINSAHGITPRTQTLRPRDLSVIGYVSDDQLAFAAREFKASPSTDRRVVLMHHNLVAGRLSQRYGVPKRIVPHVLGELGRMEVDLVLCGHDHEEALNYVERKGGGMMIATAGTITTMSRGKRPTAVNIIELSPDKIVGRVMAWGEDRSEFLPGLERVIGR